MLASHDVIAHMEWVVHHCAAEVRATLGWPEDTAHSLHVYRGTTGYVGGASWMLRQGERSYILSHKARSAATVLDELAAGRKI